MTRKDLALGMDCHDHPTTIRSPVRWLHSEYHRDIRPPSDHHRYPGPHPEYSSRTGWSQCGNHMVSRIYGEVPCGTTVISGITEEGHMGIIGNIYCGPDSCICFSLIIACICSLA